ncbi:hypothetical protein BU26DRAFT_181431 [Trematosphaeria pertusa]|uniref:Uncharacterized protein n=1 Tax=Trematosphaeria pertusa TaxID=390896 RepID=A0A6A6HUC8_9PLEO|nr:uncharacterized protein BU26DRAFT_181431 [Trematosphaeria pertusa]KAF2241133.1 hypothetical protein BU26DRAFT_181431 [Trematosphaeria pertusa]
MKHQASNCGQQLWPADSARMAPQPCGNDKGRGMMANAREDQHSWAAGTDMLGTPPAPADREAPPAGALSAVHLKVHTYWMISTPLLLLRQPAGRACGRSHGSCGARGTPNSQISAGPHLDCCRRPALGGGGGGGRCRHHAKAWGNKAPGDEMHDAGK